MARSYETHARLGFIEFLRRAGKVKEKAGQVINNPDLETDGHGEKVVGKFQKKVGQVEEVLEK